MILSTGTNSMFKNEAKFQLGILFLPVFVGSLASAILPRFGLTGLIALSLGCMGLGFIMSAKISEKKRTRKIVSWGTGDMTFREKTSYFIGYSMIISYFVFSIYLKLYAPIG